MSFLVGVVRRPASREEGKEPSSRDERKQRSCSLAFRDLRLHQSPKTEMEVLSTLHSKRYVISNNGTVQNSLVLANDWSGK